MAFLKNHPGFELRDDAAAAFNAYEDKYGIRQVNSARRSVADQNHLIYLYYTVGGPANRPPYLYPPARPAEASRHVAEGGIAVDIGDWRTFRQNSEEFGFYWWGEGDVVHFEFRGWAGSAPANVAAGQRTTGPNGARRRSAPSSQSPEAGDALTPGTVGNFTGWIHGENVEGNDVWYQGTSGNWFWSGGFNEGANGTGITDLNPTTPPPTTAMQRIVGPGGAKRRIGAPSTSAPAGVGLDAGEVGNFKGWVTGENVEGNSVWFVGTSGNYFWSGGFTSTSRDGLPDLNTTTPPVVTPPVTPPKNPDNPRNLPSSTPVYPGAAFGLVAPLGDGKRGVKGSGSSAVTVPVIIDRYIVHHTGTTADQLDYFSWKNGGDSCPTWYMRTSGQVIELIRPGMKPAATGAEWNWRSVAVETLNEEGEPTWRVTDAQLEAHAQLIAWLASYDGKTLDGVPVSFKIDRTHVISDRETRATICPGPYLQGKLDDGSLIARAKAIYAEKYAPTAPGDDDVVPVKRSVIQSILAALEGIVNALKGLLGSGAK